MQKHIFLLICMLALVAVPAAGQLIDESFESGAWPAGWVLETNSGNAWDIANTYVCDGSYTARYPGTTTAANSWFFTTGFPLTAGTTYVVEFQYRVSSSATANSLYVRYGSGQSSAQMFATFWFQTGINNTTCQTAYATFSPVLDGTWYLGFRCSSAANQGDLMVDAVKFYELAPVEITPDPITGSKCTTVPMNVANGAATQTFSFSHTAPGSLAVSFSPVNPSIPIGGNQDVDVIVTPVTPPNWSLISFDVTATGDTTAGSDTALFNAYPNTWHTLADSTYGDFTVCAASDGTYIYKFNGWDGNEAERYDPGTDTWTTLSSNPYHSHPAPMGACYVDGNIYIMNSGYFDSGNMYRYHIASDTYYQIPLPDGLNYLGCGEIVYYCGSLWVMGSNGIFNDDDIQFWKYDIASGIWTQIDDLSSAPAGALRIAHGMVQKNGTIYILGGGYQGVISRIVFSYDIATDTWTPDALPMLPFLACDGKAWIVGTYVFLDDGGYSDDMWVFKLNDPSWTAWQPIASMSVDQDFYGAAYQNGVLYAVNGQTAQAAMQAMTFCPLIANAGSGMCVCPDYNGSLDLGPLDGASAVGGSAPYTYTWSDGLGWMSMSPSPTYTVDPADLPITITLTVTDSLGGTDTDTLTIVSYPPLVVDAGDYAAVAPGTVYTLGGTPAGVGPTATGGKAPYTYAWTCAEDGGWNSSLEHPTYTFGTTGNYTFTVTVTDDCGTVATDSVTIDCGELRVRAGAHRVICQGDSTVLGGNPTAYNGVPPYTYSWVSNPAGFTSSSPNPTVSPVVDTMYTVTVTDVMNPGGVSGSVWVYVVPYLTAPAMLTPGDGSNLPGLYTEFAWTDVADEIGYRLHISDSQGHIWAIDLPADTVSYSMDETDGVLSRGLCYTWWVQALGDGTFCDSKNIGTFAFCVDPLPQPVSNTLIFASDQVTKGDLSNTRTNLGMISLGSAYVDAHLTLRNQNGTLLSNVDLPVGYNQYAAYTDLLDYFPAPYNEGTIDLESTDHIYLVGGLVDNVTNDPSIYPQDIEQGEHIMTPIVLRTDVWQTQVVLRNLADEDLEVTLTTFVAADKAGKGSPSKMKVVTIPGQGYFKTDDIMAWMMDPHVYALLTAEVTGGTGEITGFARQLTADNMGGIYPFYTVDGGNMLYVFPYVADTAQRRSNIGLANTNDETISVNIAFLCDGMQSSIKAYEVESYSYLAIANIIRDITGTTGIQNVEGFLILNSNSPFRVVGGPIDNTSNDPSVFGGCGYDDHFTAGFTPLVLRSGPWTSRLVLANMELTDVSVDLVLYQSGESVGTITRTVSALDILVIDDIISEFTSEDLFGSLFIYASGPIYGFVEQTTGPGGASGVYPVFSLD